MSLATSSFTSMTVLNTTTDVTALSIITAQKPVIKVITHNVK